MEPAQGRRALVRCPLCFALNRVHLGRLAQGPRCGECARPLLLDRPVKVTDEEFARVIAETEVPVVVDFYADWCQPCRVMAPVLDELASDRAGEVLVLKLDTDANPRTAEHYGIRGIPTVMAFAGGRETGRAVGVADRRQLDDLIAGALPA